MFDEDLKTRYPGLVVQRYTTRLTLRPYGVNDNCHLNYVKFAGSDFLQVHMLKKRRENEFQEQEQ